MDQRDLEFHLSDNEYVVRNYECTRKSRPFNTPIIGNLTVTNKRLVYHSHVRTFNGSSAIVSEIPLDDVSGISTSINSSFNWFLFGLFCLIMYFGSFLVSNYFPPFFTSWAFSILLVIPYGVALLFEKNIISQDVQQQFEQNIKSIPGGDLLARRDRGYYLGIFRFVFLAGLALIAWNISKVPELQELSIIAFLLIGIAYFMIYRTVFGQIRNFNLAVSSRSPKNAGIIIPGNPINVLLGGDTAAIQSLFSGPGQDAERVVTELGAVLTDIRQLGDLGIKKWQESVGA